MSQKICFFAGLAVGIAGAALMLGCVQPWSYGVPQAPQLLTALGRVATLPFGPGERLDYDIGWNGVPAATLRSEIRTDPQDRSRLTASYELRTVGTVEMIYSLRFSILTVLDQASLLPVRTEVGEQKGDQHKKVTVNYDHAKGVARLETWKSKNNRTTHKEVPIKPGLDVPSAILLLRASQAAMRQSASAVVLQEDDLFEAVATPVHSERVEVPAGSFEATLWEVKLRKLPQQGREQDQPQAEPYRNVRLWLSQEGRVPLMLEVDIPMGRLHCVLTGRQAPS